MIAITMYVTIAAIRLFGQQNYGWDKELVQKVTIIDQSVIKKLVFELFIPESDITFIEI